MVLQEIRTTNQQCVFLGFVDANRKSGCLEKLAYNSGFFERFYIFLQLLEEMFSLAPSRS